MTGKLNTLEELRERAHKAHPNIDDHEWQGDGEMQ